MNFNEIKDDNLPTKSSGVEMDRFYKMFVSE